MEMMGWTFARVTGRAAAAIAAWRAMPDYLAIEPGGTLPPGA